MQIDHYLLRHERINLLKKLSTKLEIKPKQALYEKRIPKQYWEEALADYPDQWEKIESFLRSRLDETSDEKQKKKAIDALIRRGHSYGTIRRVLQNLSFDSDDFIEDF